eukprot:scaffold71292_cov19-Tisochrysis_lutea.AAC.1
MADVDRVLGGSAAARERSALQADQMGDDMVMGRASVADALVKMRGKSLAGGRNGVLGSASTALEELGASMLDVRAVLAGLLSEMKLLGQLVDMHRWVYRGFARAGQHMYLHRWVAREVGMMRVVCVIRGEIKAIGSCGQVAQWMKSCTKGQKCLRQLYGKHLD